MAGDGGIVPELYCSDFERSLAFYTGVVGFRVLYERPAERFAYLQMKDAELMIEQTVDIDRRLVAAELIQPYGRGVNLEIPVDEVDLLHARILAGQCRVFLPLEERWYRRDDVDVGVRQFVRDGPRRVPVAVSPKSSAIGRPPAGDGSSTAVLDAIRNGFR